MSELEDVFNMQISKTSNKELVPYFKESEFYSKDPAAPDPHFLHDQIPTVLTFLRQVYGSEIEITSTYRGQDYNRSIGGSNKSQHLKGLAIDFKFKDAGSYRKFYEDIKAMLQKLEEFFRGGKNYRNTNISERNLVSYIMLTA